MFRIHEICTERFNIKLKRSVSPNQITVLTGPNGSGKTELLTSLADWFRNLDSDDKNIQGPVSQTIFRDGHPYKTGGVRHFSYSGNPTRVIAQTFSPFSRFKNPKTSNLKISDIYSDDHSSVTFTDSAHLKQDRYRVVGIHLSTVISPRTLARNTLEKGLFRLSEMPEQARIMGDVLWDLGFERDIHLAYSPSPLLIEMLEDNQYRNLNEYFLSIDDNKNPAAKKLYAAEVGQEDPEKFISLLEEVFRILRSKLREKFFEISFNLNRYGSSEDFAEMQALVLLRRIGLLKLTKCGLRLAATGESMDLANASSGQQQMLSSIFGIVGELSKNALVLIDEPELSLHPTWQMSFLTNLELVFKRFEGCHVFIATHSPLIVQKAMESGYDVIQLKTVSTDDDTQPEMHSSTSVEAALLDVFKTPIGNSIYLANEIFELVVLSDENHGEKNIAIDRLSELRKLYQNSREPSEESLSLIDDAIELIELSNGDADVQG